jgi:hypothetical protein
VAVKVSAVDDARPPACVAGDEGAGFAADLPAAAGRVAPRDVVTVAPAARVLRAGAGLAAALPPDARALAVFACAPAAPAALVAVFACAPDAPAALVAVFARAPDAPAALVAVFARGAGAPAALLAAGGFAAAPFAAPPARLGAVLLVVVFADVERAGRADDFGWGIRSPEMRAGL